MTEKPPSNKPLVGKASGSDPPPPPVPPSTPKIDHNSPFYLSSNDNLENIISTVVFTGNNYDARSKSLRFSLIARRKFGFIDGSVEKFTSGILVAHWKTIPYFEEARPLWIVLQRRFDVGSGTHKQQLKTALSECKQSTSISIGDYFGKLQPLWDELATYDPIPSYVCGFCICDLGEKFQQKQDNDQLHDFLCGIHVDHFGALRSSLLSQNPPPTLDRAYHAMLQEEQLQSHWVFAPEREATMTLPVQASRGTPKSDSRSKSSLSCIFYDCSGHDISSCFSKHGFPDWWGIVLERREAALAAYATVQAHAAGGSVNSVRSQGGASNFSNTDWMKLKQLLGNSDLGNEDRLTGDLGILSDIVDIPGCPIGLPDGKISSAIKSGTDHTSRNLIGVGECRNGSYYFLQFFGDVDVACGWEGWKLFDLDSHEYFVSRDVVFYENDFPFASSTPSASVTSLPQVSNHVCDDDDDVSGDEGPSGEALFPSTPAGGVLPRSVEEPALLAESSSVCREWGAFAYIFTNALGKRQFDFSLRKLGILDLHAST
ncbi:hypothetical protein LIER_21054 [Lithospermum erythrorhizon]|uniref:Retrotransposon Copia-like N-terminal domain-containing protein n=1 Tax=Lithospermum erythrorhizon TaxID=34254 RepID=A0AAV3QNW0_LITER